MPPENLRKCFNCNLLKQYPANPWLCKLDQGLDFIIKDLSLSVIHNNCWPNFKWFSVLFLQIQPVLNNKGKVSCWRKQRGPLMGLEPTTSTLWVSCATHYVPLYTQSLKTKAIFKCFILTLFEMIFAAISSNIF